MQKVVIKLLVSSFLCLYFCVASAESYSIKLEDANINTHDVKSIQRGAKTYAAYCLVCHSLDYMKHDPIARAAGITADKFPDKNQKWWFGATPPDLSLVARVHSADWLYTYLHAFYKDPSKQSGNNNLLVDNVNMPNPFLGIQGEQSILINKTYLFSESPPFARKLPYYSVLELTKKGSLSSDEFDNVIRDLVNFLVYASDPKKYTREKLGFWVLLFIAILFVLIFLLKRDYWKNKK